jgi:hypothetical protein
VVVTVVSVVGTVVTVVDPVAAVGETETGARSSKVTVTVAQDTLDKLDMASFYYINFTINF